LDGLGGGGNDAAARAQQQQQQQQGGQAGASPGFNADEFPALGAAAAAAARGAALGGGGLQQQQQQQQGGMGAGGRPGGVDYSAAAMSLRKGAGPQVGVEFVLGLFRHRAGLQDALIMHVSSFVPNAIQHVHQ
jgi:hypothetical protein